MTVHEIIRVHPRPTSLDRDVLLRCIDECVDCEATCTGCADACLGEEDVQELVRCIRLCLDCADTCETTGRILIRQTEPEPAVIRAVVEACATACQVSAEECDRHAAHHEHCRFCAEVCRRCKQACDDVLSALS
jgi:hypothetical protein